MRFAISAMSVLALAVSAPAMAQDGADDDAITVSERAPGQVPITILDTEELDEFDADAGIEDIFAGMAPDPLTEEQQALLPLSESIIAKLMPVGSFGEMMDSMMGDFLDPFETLMGDPAVGALASQLGLSTTELTALEEDELNRVAALIDPDYRERQELQSAAEKSAMREMMTAMEVPIRKAMSEAYARTFTRTELEDTDAFFATTSGASYAAKSWKLASDPSFMFGAMAEMGSLFEDLGNLEADIAAADADLPEPRSFEDLSASQRTELAGILGYTVDELELVMSEELGMDEFEEEMEAMEAAMDAEADDMEAEADALATEG